MSDTTTKNDLIESMAVAADISKAAAGRALEALTDKITIDLQHGRDVALIGFGSFTTSERKARVGRNPQTGEEIQIAKSTVPRFKAGKKLKEAVNHA